MAIPALVSSLGVPDWLITGCSELLTLRGPAPRRGRGLRELGIVHDGALLVRDDRILAVGQRRKVERLGQARRAEKLDLGGRVVLPGFVDSHTHLVFPTSRAEEYEQRIFGKTYQEIARAGGGIRATVRAVRRSSEKALSECASARLREFAAHGTTTLEAKSGYGLNWKNELKILSILQQLHQDQPLDIVQHSLARMSSRPNSASARRRSSISWCAPGFRPWRRRDWRHFVTSSAIEALLACLRRGESCRQRGLAA